MRKTRIAIDIRDLRVAKTGAKTYLAEICRQFKEPTQGITFFFIDTWLPVYTGQNKLLKIVEHIRFQLWKQVYLPLFCIAKRCDILYCTDYFLPVIKAGYKTAVVFHDAFCWEYPEQYNQLWLGLLNSLGVYAARKADAVITMSEHSKKQIIKHVGISPERIHVIYLAAKTMDAAPSNAPSPVPGKYILHVGVLEKRKNLPNLIRAFDLLIKSGFVDYKLVLAGGRINKTHLDDYPNILSLIRQLSLEEKVWLPGFVREEDLPTYYAHASLYAFVSLNEGFGIPLLEAFNAKVPALIADNSCLPEIAGDAAVCCDPHDAGDIKQKMEIILSDPDLQQELIRKGSQRARLFSWKANADELLRVFAQILVLERNDDQSRI